MAKQQKLVTTDSEAAVSTKTEEKPAPTPSDSMESQAMPDGATVSWTASEFIAHEKSAGWYAGVAGVAAVLVGIIFLLTRDFISCAVVVVCAAMFGVYAARQPRELRYSLTPSGITIGPKHYAYAGFRSFSISHEGAFASIDFMPLKRFLPVLTVYYSPEDEPAIVSVLDGRLPYQEPRHDAVERLLRRIRF